MDKIDKLLKAAQWSDESPPNMGVGAFSTPPRPRPSVSGCYTSQDPPPPPLHRVEIVSNPFITSNSSNVIAMPSLSSSYGYVAKKLVYHTASTKSSFAYAPTATAHATSAVSMTRPPAAWLLHPRSSVQNQFDQVGLAAAALAATTASPASGEVHVHDPPTPMCFLFPDIASTPRRSNVQAYYVPEDTSAKQPAIPQGYSFADATIIFDKCFKPIAVHPLASLLVSPAESKKKSKYEDKSINYFDLSEERAKSSSCNVTTAAVGSTELKPSKDEAPPATPKKKRAAVLTPDTELLETAPLSPSIILPPLFDEDDAPFLTEGNFLVGTQVIEPIVVPDEYPAVNASTITKKASTSKSNKKKKPNFRARTVAFRCRFCKHKNYFEREKLSTVYPRLLKNVYRANLRFKSEHLSKCSHIPRNLKRRIAKVEKKIQGKEDRENSPFESKKSDLLAQEFWVKTMKRKGFVDGVDGISFKFKAPEHS